MSKKMVSGNEILNILLNSPITREILAKRMIVLDIIISDLARYLEGLGLLEDFLSRNPDYRFDIEIIKNIVKER